ncbi:uncharacterized protein UTRI_06203 [Ustilago trichophora]|uniref:Effector family protein Eff1 n=1 Tax=Ustilago trichophora TaxID=86804 RepID=A0A5C3EF12_9BASI|nr:uncharacterized protein UTRI_06203 [Ustilago trichophora]
MLCHIFLLAFILPWLVASHENLPVLPAIFHPNAGELLQPYNLPRLVLHFDRSTLEAHASNARNYQAASLALQANAQIERGFQLPQGHLFPTYAYQPSQQRAIQEYLGRPDSQMHILFRHGPPRQGWTLYGSPVYLHSYFHNRSPALIVLKVFDDGEVQPIGFTGTEGNPWPHAGRNFWERLAQFPSSLTWQRLSDSYGTPLRFRSL